jgi:hypothetical protein
MALSFTNTTCDIYRNAHAPPAAPDIAGVPCAFAHRGASTLTSSNYTHVIFVDASVDVRDHATGSGAGLSLDGANCDHLWVPDKNGTRYDVVMVRKAGAHKQILVQRVSPTWPGNNWI